MASLGANITIPDQVVLVGGTGRHLSERFAIISENLDRFGPGRVNNGYSPPKTIQDRLGPRRFTGNDYNVNVQDDLLYSMQPSRQHVLKRLGQPANNYNTWGGQNYAAAGGQNDVVNGGGAGYSNERSNYNTYNPGQIGRGRGRRRWFGYGGGGGYRGGYNRYYSPYSSYYSSYSSPYSYYGSYSKPRFGNYTKYYGSSYTSFRSRGYGYGYRGNYNSNGYGGSRYSRGRRGRFARNAGRAQLTQEDLDRELDDYRSGHVAKEERSSDVNM